jgi:uncharacterized membrane protein
MRAIIIVFIFYLIACFATAAFIEMRISKDRWKIVTGAVLAPLFWFLLFVVVIFKVIINIPALIGDMFKEITK